MCEHRRRVFSFSACGALLVLAGCSAPADAPAKPGVCFIQGAAPAGMPAKGARPPFNVLSVGDANLETCAMHLEVASFSKHRRDLLGAFQGQYVFVTREAISSSDSLSGQRFSLFTPGQRADVDAQIIDLLKPPVKPTGLKGQAPANASAP